uniref:Mos1 transposase HTH domain-containing protein n=1 Tax=Strongyloides stercoralis TaxID=6248 RepID=A0AAF5I371_STRER
TVRTLEILTASLSKKTEIKEVIKYFLNKDLSATEIKADLDGTLRNSASSFVTLKKWVAEFRRGRTSIKVADRLGRPTIATSEKIVQKVHKIIMGNCRLKFTGIAETVGISKDNAPSHKPVVVMAKIYELKFQLVSHVAYLLDLASSEFSLSLNLKKFLAEKRFKSDSVVILAASDYFQKPDICAYKKEIQALEHRWRKCISLQGDYVEE